jgi:N-acyl homoserine lactone hydrolase
MPKSRADASTGVQATPRCAEQDIIDAKQSETLPQLPLGFCWTAREFVLLLRASEALASLAVIRSRARRGWMLGIAAAIAVILWLAFGRPSAPPAGRFAPPPARPGATSIADVLKTPIGGLKVYVFATGEIEVPGNAMLDPRHPKVRPDEVRKQFVPAMAFLVRHPTRGDVLVDTGFGPAFVNHSSGDLGWYTRPFVRTRVPFGADLLSQFASVGARPDSLVYVVITHGHVDHTGGLPALGPVHVLVGKGERAAIVAPLSLSRGYKQAHFASVGQLDEVDFDAAPELLPLGRAVDLFGDGSIFLADAHGHTPGHLSVLVNLAGGPLILTGDTVQTQRAFDDGIPSGNVTDRQGAYDACARLLALKREFPSLRALFGHDVNDALHAKKPPEAYE